MPAAAKLEPTTHSEPGPLRILVAEDSEITSNLLNLLLTKRGHSVTCVEDGKAARDQLSAHDFDVCLIDFHLPLLNGLEVVKQFRDSDDADGRSTCFIGMTADVEGLLADPTNCEILDVVFGKPIVADEIYEAVEHINRHRDGPRPAGRSFGNVTEFRIRKANAESAQSPGDGRVYQSSATGEVLPDRRRAQRTVVSLGGTRLIRANGEQHTCRIISLSCLGAALETDCRPRVGEAVQVGRSKAVVVRSDADCVSVDFVIPY
jgi:CheY-like chemotaxis protein